jgi:hypothetical protein
MSRITHFSNKGVFLLLLGYCLLVANFVELRYDEVRRKCLPSGRLNNRCHYAGRGDAGPPSEFRVIRT